MRPLTLLLGKLERSLDPQHFTAVFLIGWSGGDWGLGWLGGVDLFFFDNKLF